MSLLLLLDSEAGSGVGFTPFDHRLGVTQGRLDPVGYEPPEGDFAFVLGSDVVGDIHDFNVGDHVELQQMIDLTGENFVRAAVRLRNAELVPAGVNWEASITVAGAKRSAMVLETGRQRDRVDMAANVSKLAGTQIVGLRLELIAA